MSNILKCSFYFSFETEWFFWHIKVPIWFQSGCRWLMDQENVYVAKPHIRSQWTSAVSSWQHVADHSSWQHVADHSSWQHVADHSSWQHVPEHCCEANLNLVHYSGPSAFCLTKHPFVSSKLLQWCPGKIPESFNRQKQWPITRRFS